ncbi:MAG: 4'-phosphopantetheinyl transferase superfamily protein [Ardenticatenaceae bacterium]|nr:4'-phosphopantetheinyl transferase superfamily protein [Ardenticatenaceae bacterium]
MIHWLVQAAGAHPELADGVSLAGMLHADEQTKLAALKTEKRRQDWVLGRWTAKQLVQTVVQQQTGRVAALPEIVVRNGRRGDPIIEYQGLAVSLSLSHAHGHAFCAVVERPSWPIGADMEWIEPRSAAFMADYLTAAEQERVSQAEGAMRDVLVTAVWSAKEAVLKALHLGLTVDTRCVECLIAPVAERPSTWTPFTIGCDDGRLPQPVPPLSGWWRVWDNFVLTLVVGEEVE